MNSLFFLSIIYFGQGQRKEPLYLILFILEDGKLNKTQIKLEQLKWISFQTRSLDEIHDIIKHTYYPVKIYPLNKNIKLIKREDNQSVYECEEFKLDIILLHTKKNERYKYYPTGTIISALETFNTIINFK